MNILLLRRLALAFVVGALAVLLSGCVVGGEYGYPDGGDIGADYYEPSGVVYGGWGPDYQVAPYRGGNRGGDHRATGEGGHASRAYRSAPASHSVPSIPSQSRSGGGSSRGGGGAGRGGGGGERGR